MLPKLENKWKIAIVLILSLVIFIRAIVDIDLPCDCDEKHNVGLFDKGELISGRYNVLDPSAHPLSAFLSYASMALFGSSCVTSRFHGILFSGLFLLLLAILSVRHFSWITISLIYLNLLVNEHAYWFFHSNRAYSIMFFLALIIPFALYDCIFKSLTVLHRLLSFLFIFFILSAMNHHLNIVYYGATVVAFLGWIFIHKSELSDIQRSKLKQIFYFSLIPLLLSGTILLFSAIDLMGRGPGYVSTVKVMSDPVQVGLWSKLYQLVKMPYNGFTATLAIFGNFKVVYHVGLFTMVSILFVLIRKKLKLYPLLSFLWLVIGVNVLFILILSFATRGWNVRYLVYMLPISLIVIGESLNLVEHRMLKWAGYLGFLVLLVWGPFFQSDPHIATHFCLKDYINVHPVRELLLGITKVIWPS